jgi:hypothetical protein
VGIGRFYLANPAIKNWRPWSPGANAFVVATERTSVVWMRSTDSKRMKRMAFSRPRTAVRISDSEPYTGVYECAQVSSLPNYRSQVGLEPCNAVRIWDGRSPARRSVRLQRLSLPSAYVGRAPPIKDPAFPVKLIGLTINAARLHRIFLRSEATLTDDCCGLQAPTPCSG